MKQSMEMCPGGLGLELCGQTDLPSPLPPMATFVNWCAMPTTSIGLQAPLVLLVSFLGLRCMWVMELRGPFRRIKVSGNIPVPPRTGTSSQPAWPQGPPTIPPVVTGGLGRGFWPKRPLRIPLGFHMKIAPELKNKWPNTVISV